MYHVMHSPIRSASTAACLSESSLSLSKDSLAAPSPSCSMRSKHCFCSAVTCSRMLSSRILLMAPSESASRLFFLGSGLRRLDLVCVEVREHVGDEIAPSLACELGSKLPGSVLGVHGLRQSVDEHLDSSDVRVLVAAEEVQRETARDVGAEVPARAKIRQGGS
jgi:hypothetical protein